MKRNLTLITGASGFIGQNLCRLFVRRGIAVRAAVREQHKPQASLCPSVVVQACNDTTDWTEALGNVEIIVHLAARVHVMREHVQDPLAAFKAVNVDGTLNLARQAAAAGVKRFIFLSSIKVNGEKTDKLPFRSSNIPAPVDPYAVSKLAAEKGLHDIARATGLEVVIIRPPLVYGKQAEGNFDRLRKIAATGWPLPLGSVRNKRSLIGIDNLCDCIRVCLKHPNASRAPLLVSDNQDISTPDLVRLLAAASGRKAWLIPVPVGLLLRAAKVFRRESEVKRLTENLQIDSSETIELLNWRPPFSLEQGIKSRQK